MRDYNVKIDGVELREGDHVLIRALSWSEMTRWQKTRLIASWWRPRVRRAYRYRVSEQGIYRVSEGGWTRA